MPDWVRHVRDHLALPELEPRREDELIQDLAQQLDDVYQDALARGESEEAAAAFARSQVGSWPVLARDLTEANAGSRRLGLDRLYERSEEAVLAASARRGRVGRWFDQARLDMVYGLRQLAAHRGFTIVALLTLGLGIGVNAAMFGVVRSLLSGAAQFPDPDRLVLVHRRTAEHRPLPIAEDEYRAISGRSGAFSQVAGFDNVERTLGGMTDALTVRAVTCSADFAAMLGLRPVLGRLPAPNEYLPGADPVVVITERLWRRAFAADPGVVGRSVTVDGAGHSIVGVLRESASMETLAYTAFDVVMPRSPGGRTAEGTPAAHRVIARLAPGVSRERAQAELMAVSAGLPQSGSAAGAVSTFHLQPLGEFLVPVSRRAMSATLLAAVVLVLLMACLNLASMYAARAGARGRELAIRAALGAGRGRILRQLMTECLMLAGAGGALGVMTGVWVLRVVALVDDAPLYVREAMRVDAGLFGYAFVLCLIAAVVFGLGPAVLAARASGDLVLRQRPSAAPATRRPVRLSSALVIAELAVGVPLLVAMSLVLRSLTGQLSADPGFQVDQLITMRIDLPAFRYGSDAARAVFAREALERLRVTPGTTSVGAASGFPIGARASFHVLAKVEGSQSAAPDEPDSVACTVVTPEFVETLGVPLLRGRRVTDGDTAVSDRVALVNRQLATRYWPGEDPVGRTIDLDPGSKNQRRVTVVGVVGDFGRGLQGGAPEPQVFVPNDQQPVSRLVVVARVSGDGGRVAQAMRQTIRDLDRDVPVSDVMTAAEIRRRWLRDDEVLTWFLSGLAGLALSLSVIGLYGLMAQVVAQRTREIGVRMAMGATRVQIARMVILRSARLSAIGLAVGGIASVPLGLAIATQLYGVSGADPRAFAFVGGLLLAAGVVAGYLPARRAARVDPVAALRCE